MIRFALALALVALSAAAAVPRAGGPLPPWESSASGPLRPDGTNALGGDLVVTFDDFEISAYSHVGPISGRMKFSVPFETRQGWTGYVREGHTPPTDTDGCMAEEYIVCDPATGGNLVMMWHYGSEFLSIDGLDSARPRVKNYFGNYTGSISFSRVFSLPGLAALAEAPRNWYAGALLATNPPASAGGRIPAEALVLPEGLYVTHRSSGEVIVAEPAMIRALVGRYRAGLAPTNIAVTIEHVRTRPAGRVTALRHEPGRGLWASVELSVDPAGYAASPEILCAHATARDSWGAWGQIKIPWQLKGLALTLDPALPKSEIDTKDTK